MVSMKKTVVTMKTTLKIKTMMTSLTMKAVQMNRLISIPSHLDSSKILMKGLIIATFTAARQWENGVWTKMSCCVNR